MTDGLSDGHYTVQILENLLIVNNHENLLTLLQLTTTPQLFVMCEGIELLIVEIKQTFKCYLIL